MPKSADPAAQSLVVSGRNEHVKAIEEIVAELRLKPSNPATYHAGL